MLADSSWNSLMSTLASCCLDPIHITCVLSAFNFSPSHQGFDPLRAADEPLDSCLYVRCSSANMYLRVIGIRVRLHILVLDNVQQLCPVEQEQYWTKHGTLWDAKNQPQDARQLTLECHLLHPVHEEGSYPFESQTLNAIRPLQVNIIMMIKLKIQITNKI